jgi:hypothetical protein
MMPTLPNILPTTSPDSFRGGEAEPFQGTPGKTGEPFDHLMARALSPSSKEANQTAGQNPPARKIATDLEKQNISQNKLPDQFQIRGKIAGNSNDVEAEAGNFPLQPGNPKSGAQKSGKNHSKKGSGNSDVAANSSGHSEDKVAAVNSENISTPMPAPAVAMVAQKSELSAKAAVAGKFAGIPAVLPEVKNFPPAAAKVSNLIIPQNQESAEPNQMAESVGQEKITAAAGALAAEKTNSTDSKIAGLQMTSSQVSPSAKNAGGDLTPPKPAVESFAQSPQSGLSPAPDLTLKTTAQASSGANGTPVAQQDAPMKKTEKTDKITSSAGKILPGDAVSVARANNLPPRENFSALALSRAGQMDANTTANPSASKIDVAPLSADSASTIASVATVDFRSRNLERAQDMIVLHAARLSDSGNDSLQVVIKPGAGMQLSLELRQRGDGVEVQAVLQRGDFERLNQQWPGLQQQLEQRGIRLAPLASDGNFAGSDNNNFQHKQNQPAELDSFPAGAFVEVAPAGSFAQTAARTGTHHGWETWA